MKVVLQNLTKRFPNRNRKGGEDVIAVNDFNFEIPDGKLVGLLGPSGCGKSTTLFMICGLQEPTEGRILFGDEDVTDLPPEKRGVGVVFQNYALYPHLTVKQNIIFPLQNLKGAEKLTKEQMDEKALEAAKLVQIEGLLERRPSELSGGQQQRVAIARALIAKPRIVFADEPTGNLDTRTGEDTMRLLMECAAEFGQTLIVVTHNPEIAQKAQQVIRIEDGQILKGEPQHEKGNLDTQ